MIFLELIAKRVNGTADVTPSEINKWQTVEKICRDSAESYGFKEIRIPTFENTELFVRSVGDTTDVVTKEMFTVTGRESTFTLRPEGTAGAIRSMLENGMLNDALPQKVYYILSCFRHEKPQAGRLWEFHQFGVEMAGSSSPFADAEAISLAKNTIERFGLKNVALNINSIGCPECRKKYYTALRDFLKPHFDELCDTCKSRFEKNPMRILDCKSEICQNIAKDAPTVIDYLCDDCAAHFEKLKSILDSMGINYTVNPKIVRGLDYYTKTVFEFIAGEGKTRGTVCGGGRYDKMISEMGGKDTPALGFAMGLERIILNMEAQKCAFIEPKRCDIYIAPMGEEAALTAMKLTDALRKDGTAAETDLMGRSFGKQLKYANTLKARFLLVIGDEEISRGIGKLKNMDSGESTEISLGEDFCKIFTSHLMAGMIEGTL